MDGPQKQGASLRQLTGKSPASLPRRSDLLTWGPRPDKPRQDSFSLADLNPAGLAGPGRKMVRLGPSGPVTGSLQGMPRIQAHPSEAKRNLTHWSPLITS